MRPEGSFVADRLAAQHCAELLRGSRQAVNPLVELAQFGERFATLLSGQIGQMFPGVKTSAVAGEPAELPANVNERRGEPMFTSVISVGPKDAALFASLPQAAAHAMIDIALGGTGKVCEAPGAKPPLSVQLMFARFEKMMAGVLADAFELGSADDVRIKNVGAAPEAVAPLAGCKRTTLSFRIAIAEAEPCEFVLTFSGGTLATLFADRAKASATPARACVIAPNAEPYAAIPLPIKAVLVDMAVAVSTLSSLRPGMVIPVAVARSVPLFAGDQIIGHGTVGSLDDCTALQMTRISSIKEK